MKGQIQFGTQAINLTKLDDANSTWVSQQQQKYRALETVKQQNMKEQSEIHKQNTPNYLQFGHTPANTLCQNNFDTIQKHQKYKHNVKSLQIQLTQTKQQQHQSYSELRKQQQTIQNHVVHQQLEYEKRDNEMRKNVFVPIVNKYPIEQEVKDFIERRNVDNSKQLIQDLRAAKLKTYGRDQRRLVEQVYQTMK